MHRFYIPASRWNLDALALDEGETHHALDVLRIQVGETVTVFNGEGVEATAEVTSVGKKRLSLRLLESRMTAPLAARITLAQAIPKGKNMDLIVQKATELGAASIIPLLSERTVVQFDNKEGAKKQEKWQGVAIEAAKQCGQNWLPTVQAPVTPKAMFARKEPYDLMLIASLQPETLHPKALIEAVTADTGKRPSNVLVLVGPEGDFTPAEITFAIANGCRPITLGPIVLRSETAAIYCVSILAYELL